MSLWIKRIAESVLVWYWQFSGVGDGLSLTAFGRPAQRVGVIWLDDLARRSGNRCLDLPRASEVRLNLTALSRIPAVLIETLHSRIRLGQGKTESVEIGQLQEKAIENGPEGLWVSIMVIWTGPFKVLVLRSK